MTRPADLRAWIARIESLGELRPGQPLDIDVSAQDYRRTDAGLAVDMVTEIRGEGRVLWRESCCFLSRWAESAERPAGRPPDAHIAKIVDQGMRSFYSEANAEVKLDLSPLIEQMQRNLQGGVK